MSKVSLLVFFRRHQRVWCFPSWVGDNLFLLLLHQLTLSLFIFTLFFLIPLTFSLFIVFLIFYFINLTYFFLSRLFSLFFFSFSTPNSSSLLLLSSSTNTPLWHLVTTALHSSLGFFSVFVPEPPQKFHFQPTNTTPLPLVMQDHV